MALADHLAAVLSVVTTVQCLIQGSVFAQVPGIWRLPWDSRPHNLDRSVAGPALEPGGAAFCVYAQRLTIMTCRARETRPYGSDKNQ